jgi:hypothetical protein
MLTAVRLVCHPLPQFADCTFDCKAAAALQYFTQNTGLYAGGDMNAFQNQFPTPATSIKLKFVARP